MVTVAALASGRDNNFNLIRMLAAVGVIVSHAYPLALGPGTAEPLQDITGGSLGGHAVKVFFVLSGFFIMKSFERRSSLADFWLARSARIYPGLLLATCVTAFLIGPIFTTLPFETYIASGDVVAYAPRALSFYFLSHALPGVFTDNPYPDVVNGSLWTLFYEVLCYIGLCAAGVVGLLSRRRFPLFLIAYVLVYLVARDRFPLSASLSFPFILGMAAYVYRDKIPLHGAVAAALVAACLGLAAAGIRPPEAWALAFGYGALWFGAADLGLRRYNRLGDYSYGTYIYGFPVEQCVVTLIPGIAPIGIMIVSLPAIIFAAIISWHLVERPSLERRHVLARWRKPQGGGQARDGAPAEHAADSGRERL